MAQTQTPMEHTEQTSLWSFYTLKRAFKEGVVVAVIAVVLKAESGPVWITGYTWFQNILGWIEALCFD